MNSDFDDKITKFNNLILNLNSVEEKKIDQLNELCELLRLNEELRKNFSEKFYQILCSQLDKYLKNENINETHILLLKLLRNTYGCVKKDFTPSEARLCDLLIEFSINLVNEGNESENNRKFIVLILQYFANLIQGNFSTRRR
jgi:hypothetical protein